MVKIYEEKFENFEEKKGGIRPSKAERFFNFLLCRCDLNKETLEAPPVSFKDLFRFGSKKDKTSVIIAIICGTLAGALYNFPFFIGGKVATALIYYGKESGNEKLLSSAWPWVAVNLFLAISVFLLTYFQTFLLKRSCTNIITNLRIKFIESLLRQDARWMDQQKFGILNAELTESIDVIRDGIGEKVALVVRGISSLIGCIIFSIYVDWKSFLIVFGCAPISVLLMSFMAKLISISTKKQLPYSEKAASILQESLINVKTIQCCNGEKEMIQRYRDALKAGRGFAVLNFVWNGFFDGLTFFLLYIFFSSTFYYGAISYFKGEISSPGDVFIIPNAFFGAAYTMAIVSPHFVAILKARVAAAKIYAKIDRVPLSKLNEEENEHFESMNGGTIQFKDVKFSYKNGHEILKGISFDAPEGQVTALVGHSGCGKSTCIALLTRLYEYNSGKIQIGGIDIQKATIGALRKIIGIVRQEPVLFSGTIMDNIRFENSSITDSEIQKACKIANAHDFIEKLAEGYSTQIGSGAVQLSGGQKQRIAIARAIVGNPKILLLDEATSALDSESEVLVQEALNKASSGRTTIVIAHRLSTLRDANKIVVFSDGKVSEEGTHIALKEKGGLYAQLVKAQEFKEKTQNVKLEDEHQHQQGFQRQRSTSENSTENIPLTSADPFNAEYDDDAPISLSLQNHGLLLLYKNCKRQKRKLVWATIASFIRGLELPLFVFSLNFVFTELDHKDNWETYQRSMMLFLIWSLGLGIYSFFSIFIPTSLYGWAAVEMVDAIRIRALATFVRKDASFFDQKETSNAKLLAKINSDAPQLSSALDNRMVHFVNNTVAVVILLIQGAIYCWQVVLVGGVGISIMMGFMYYFGKKAHEKMNQIAGLCDSANTSVEIIENVRTIQLLTCESYFLKKFSEATKKLQEEDIKASKLDAVVLAIAFASVYVCDFISYGIGIWMIYSGYASSNGVFIAAMNVTMTSWAIQFASWSLIDIFHAKPAAESLIPLLDGNVDDDGLVDDEAKKGIDKNIEGKIEVRNVTFAYPARPEIKVANGLNLRADVAKTIALVGPSGGGKSTIIQLLERFYHPQGGNIKIDNTDIGMINLQNLRKQMALVGQEPILFSGTIIQNISLGIKNISMEEIKDACRMANASNFIEKMPLGYETECGEKGGLLSGGQKQRIAIARAIARKPKILLLDEATSALDSESERAVQIALETASKLRTTITIAHRLSSIQNANKIFFIEAGKVVEAGSHEELIEANGKYADLVRKQELTT